MAKAKNKNVKKKVNKISDKVEEKVVEKEEVNETLDDETEILESNKQIKSKKDPDEKSTISKVINIVLWIVLFAWMAIVLVDFFKVKNEEDAIFCLAHHTTKYDDGVVESCTGLGYKVYRYKRDSFKAIEFGPFWTKDSSAKNDSK